MSQSFLYSRLTSSLHHVCRSDTLRQSCLYDIIASALHPSLIWSSRDGSSIWRDDSSYECVNPVGSSWSPCSACCWPGDVQKCSFPSYQIGTNINLTTSGTKLLLGDLCLKGHDSYFLNMDELVVFARGFGQLFFKGVPRIAHEVIGDFLTRERRWRISFRRWRD